MIKTIFAIIFALMSLTHVSAENIVFPADAGIVNVKDHGAKGDGITDDTAAIQKALDAGRMRGTYFPNGIYLISDGVGIFDAKPHGRGRFMTVQGQSEAGTIIKLVDNAPAFQDPENPKVVFSTYEGKSTGDAMFSNARNMTIDIGKGNPGAVAFRYMTNNFGTMEHMTFRSSDPDGVGAIGMDLRQSQNGPGMIKNITVEGFDIGAASGNSFSLVLEGITIKNPRKIGFDSTRTRLTIRKLTVENAPVPIQMGKHSQLALIDSTFTGGDGSSPAIAAEGNSLFLRNVSQRGYTALAHTSTEQLNETSINEWTSASTYSLFGEPAETLNLAILETPEVPWEEDLSKWVAVSHTAGDVTDELQAAIDEAARTGKTTLYFPYIEGKEKFTLSGPVRVHGSVNRILGMNNLVVVKPSERFTDETALFTFKDLDSENFVIERFFQIGGWDNPAVTAFDNQSDAVLILKNLNLTMPTKFANPGKLLFLEDFCPGRATTFPIGKRERVYARQFNPESSENEMVVNRGGLFWCLGLKTEGRTTHILAEDGASVEVLGGVTYQSWRGQRFNPPMFISRDSNVSVTMGYYSHGDRHFDIYFEASEGSVTKQFKRLDIKGYCGVFRAGTL